MLNATNLISNAEKALSYSSLHALSNDAKRGLICKEIVIKRLLQWHCPLSSSPSLKIIFALHYIRYE
jgi:hypothetical protein